MKCKIFSNKAFTLIEILVVVLIIGILAAIAVPKYQISVLRSKYARAVQTASDIRKAYELYYLQYGVYPTKFSDLDFANKLSNSNSMTTEDYSCSFNNTYHEIACYIGGNNLISYYINFYTWDTSKITTLCRTHTTDKTNIYHKVCQQETGKKASQAYCSDSYCNYFY